MFDELDLIMLIVFSVGIEPQRGMTKLNVEFISGTSSGLDTPKLSFKKSANVKCLSPHNKLQLSLEKVQFCASEHEI